MICNVQLEDHIRQVRALRRGLVERGFDFTVATAKR